MPVAVGEGRHYSSPEVFHVSAKVRNGFRQHQLPEACSTCGPSFREARAGRVGQDSKVSRPPSNRDAFRDFLADSAGLMLLAEEGQHVGCLGAQFQNRPEGRARFPQRLLYTQHMAVAPQFRSRGVGGLVVARADDVAQRPGIKQVELDVWSFVDRGFSEVVSQVR